MTNKEIKDLASRYAEAMCSENSYNEDIVERNIDLQITKDDAEPIIKWLSDRYCIVEKSKLKRMYLDIQTSKIHADEMNGRNRYWSMKGKQDLIDDLFGKELFSNTEQ